MKKEFKKQEGFSLTELLVVLSIFIIVVVIIFSIYLTSSKYYQAGEDMAEVNQNGRVVLERMVREIRQARELVSELPETAGSEIPDSLPSLIEFEDGHKTESYWYVSYFKQGDEMMREEKRYYFPSNPEEFLPWNASSSEEDLVFTIVKGPEIIGEYLSDVRFWYTGCVNIFLSLEKNDKKTDLKSKVFGRNL